MKKRLPRTISRAELYKNTVRKSIFAYVLVFAVYAGFAVYFTVYLKEKFWALFFVIVGILDFGACFISLRVLKKTFARYYSLCDNHSLKIVLILPKTRKLTRSTFAEIYIYFLAQDAQTAIEFAKTTAYSLQKGIPMEAKKRARRECFEFERRNQNNFFGSFAPIDLCELRNKQVLLCQSVLEFYGEPNRAVLSQNGCELKIIDEKTQNATYRF